MQVEDLERGHTVAAIVVHSPDEPDSTVEGALRDRKLGFRADVDWVKKVGLCSGAVHVVLQIVLGIVTGREAAATEYVEASCAPRSLPEPLAALTGRAPRPQHRTRSTALDCVLQATFIRVLVLSEHLVRRLTDASCG